VKLKTVKGNSKFSAWLYSFTYNSYVNYVQRNDYKKKEKITVIADQIKEDDDSDEIHDAQLFELKSQKLGKAGSSQKVVGFLFYAKIFVNLKRKCSPFLTPLNSTLNAFILALKDSA
jgi:hypothetical protein